MSAYQIDPRRVHGVVAETQRVLSGQNFYHGEVLVGLAEVLGRTIVDCCKTPIQAADAAKVVAQHLQQTLEAGFSAKGYNMGGGNDPD